jgi:sugar phosphate isomerase/epimerase
MQTAIDRLKRMAGYAEEKGVLLLLENLNWEPVLAEVNYMPVTPAETMHFLTEINSPAVRWSFTANHAHFLPGVGISNFIDAVDFSLCHEVRLADNNGSYEIHQRPGEGTIDFGAMFKKIEGLGYKGHYTNGFTTIDDMLAGRDYMVARAAEAGVKID